MKKDKSNSNKSLVIGTAICGGIIAVLIFVLAFADTIIGKSLLLKAEKTIEKSGEILVSDPAYNDSILPTSAECVLSGERAAQIADRMLKITESARFKEVFVSKAGYWDTYLRFYDEDGKAYAVYLKDDAIYLVKNDKAYLFEVDKSAKEEYNLLCEDVRTLLK